jgi:hypothetical protein
MMKANNAKAKIPDWSSTSCNAGVRLGKSVCAKQNRMINIIPLPLAGLQGISRAKGINP